MNILKTLRKWSAYRVTVRELNALDDRTLNDLGISRGDIHPLARDYANKI